MTYKNDKNISNISFINKDFESLWTEILALIPKLTNKWVPSEANESDPLAVLLKEQAIMTDKINYNVDKNILELFPQSLTQLRSAYDVYNSMGYYPDWYISATVDLTLSRNGKVLVVQDSATNSDSDDSNSNTTNSTQQSTDEGESLFIDVFTSFSDSESKTVYVTKRAKSIKINESVSVPAIQGTALDFAVDNDRCITTDYLDAQNRIYFTESNVAQNGIFISEKDDYSDLRNTDSVWKRVDNLSQELSGQKVYKFGVDAVNNACYIQFPNDIGSLIGSGLYIKYIKSDGVNGNITVKSITQFFDDITIKSLNDDDSETALVAKDGSSVKINDLFTYTTNLLGATNGKDPMTIDEMNLGYDKVKNVFNTLVTLLDYKNYLYNYQDANSRNIVSNIQVSDRSNDLYQSYNVKSFDAANNINVDIVKSNISNRLIVDEEGQITANIGTIIDEDVLTAYNIRFYPLAYSSDVSSLGNFNNTFTQVTSANIITSAIQEAKSLNHDILENGSPVILTYDLDGYIYLNDKVSQIDANQIKNRVVTALWDRFNSRQLGFGEMPDYGELVDTIKSADDRISYVALNPITTYKQKEDDTFDKYYSSLDIIKRSILAGVTPWSTKHDYLNVKFNQTFDRIQDSNNNWLDTLPLAADSEKDTYLFTRCLPRDSNSSIQYNDATAIKLYDNEQLSIFTPSYHDSKIYTNYIYYKYTGNNARTFKANTTYQLKGEECIYIRETKPSQSDSDVDEDVLDTLRAGTYIKTDFELEPTNSYVAIGTKQICVQSQTIYNCEYTGTDKLYFSDKQCLKEFLIANMTPDSGSNIVSKMAYYIPTGSYVIRISYNNDNVATAFEIVSEGSSIQTNGVKALTSENVSSILNSYKPVQSFDLNYLSEYGDLQSIDQVAKSVQDLFPGSSNSSYVSLALNDITSFGSGCELYFCQSNNVDKAFKFSNVTSVVKSTDSSSIDYDQTTIALRDDITADVSLDSHRDAGLDLCLRYKLKDSTNFVSMTFGDLDVRSKFGLLISNFSGPVKLQKIESISNDNLTYIAHIPNILYNNDTNFSLIKNDTSNWTKYFICNKYINIGLNQKLYLTQSDKINIYVYTEAANSNVDYIYSNNGVTLPVYVNSNNSKLPIIVRAIVNTGVKYVLTTTSTTSNTILTLSSNESVKYYQPVLYNANAKVYIMNFIGTSTTDPIEGATVEGHETFKAGDVCLYNNDKYAYDSTSSSWTKLNLTNQQSLLYTSLMNIYNNREDKAKNYVELTTNYLYDSQFDPTYEPIDPIDDPTDTSTYFNKNHILNRYVMAQLKGYNADNSEATSSNPLPNLKISDLSIIK